MSESTINIESFDVDGRTIRFKQPLAVRVENKGKRYFCARHDGLNLIASANSRDKIGDEVQNELAFTWIEYVETDEDLSPGAVQLRETFRELVEA